MADKYATVDDYITSFPQDVQSVLQEVRSAILKAVPAAEETISYQMPTVLLDGRYLVYFAAWKHHVGLYPIPPAGAALERELAPYRASKGTVRFPLGEPLPCDLVERLVALLIEQRVTSD